MLSQTEQPLTELHDLVALDLDGVVNVGDAAVTHAPETLSAVKGSGTHLAFVTNNASRTPAQAAGRLRRMGIPAADEDIVSSAQAAAALLAADHEQGSRVFMLGGEGLEVALKEAGLVPITSLDDGASGAGSNRADFDVVAVVQGYGPQVPWRQVIQGAILVRDGLPWVATNLDMTIPTGNGLGPGNGTLVRLVGEFAQREPRVAGKPEPPLLHETQARVGGERPIMVGDRLDTDIEAANRVGWPSLLVFTGVTDLPTLASAAGELRPSYIGGDLRALQRAHAGPYRDGERWRCGDAEVTVEDGAVVCAQEGTDPWNGVRAAVAAAWEHLDSTGKPADVSGVSVPDPSR